MRVWLLRRFAKSQAPMSPVHHVRVPSALWTVLFVALAGCSAAPSQNILGSYFPSWMICALIGLVVTIVIRQLFAVAGIDRTLPVPLLVYLAIATAAAFATWLIWLDRA
jgi:YtcA family